MARWNKLLQEVKESQSKFHKRKIDGDKSDGGDKGNPCEKLTDTKKAGKRGDFFGGIGNKQTR